MTHNQSDSTPSAGARPWVQIMRLLVGEVFVSRRFYGRLALALVFSLGVLQALKWWPLVAGVIIMAVGVGNALFVIRRPQPTIHDYVADRNLLTNSAVAIVMIFVLTLVVGFDPSWRTWAR